MNDKVLMIAAAAVTAVICIAGMYLILESDDQNKDLNIALDAAAEGAMPSFTEFEENTKVSIRTAPYTGTDQLLNGNVSVILTSSSLGPVPGITEEKITVSGNTLFALYKSDNSTAGAFVNWLYDKP